MTRKYTKPVHKGGVVKNLETGETGLAKPNSNWYGYLSKDNAYTLISAELRLS